MAVFSAPANFQTRQDSSNHSYSLLFFEFLNARGYNLLRLLVGQMLDGWRLLICEFKSRTSDSIRGFVHPSVCWSVPERVRVRDDVVTPLHCCVGRLVHQSVCPNPELWAIFVLLPLPNHLRLWCHLAGLVAPLLLPK